MKAKKRKLPRAPLPKQTGGPHKVKKSLPARKQKYRKRWMMILGSIQSARIRVAGPVRQ